MDTEEEIRKNLAKLTREGIVGYILDLQGEAYSKGYSIGYDEGHSDGYEEGERVYY